MAERTTTTATTPASATTETTPRALDDKTTAAKSAATATTSTQPAMPRLPPSITTAATTSTSSTTTSTWTTPIATAWSNATVATASAWTSVRAALTGEAALHRAAIAEHRLLRRIPFFRSEHAHTWAEEERTAAPALLDSGKVQVETAGTRIAAATTATTTTYIGGPVSSDESVALPDSDTDMGARPRRFGPPITPIPSNLDRNPHHVHPNNRATACTRLIDIGDGHHINTFIMDTDGNVDDLIQQQRKTLVICHGFGAGLGFYYKNYTGLSVMPGLRVFSVDWLGMGRSSRAELPPRAKGVPLGHREDVEAVESFFVESLERWRASCNIERMTLCGHSLGGYLGIAYALRYPERVEKLILASPVGIPEAPVVNPFLENATATQRRMFGVFSGLWSSNVTPQSVVRALGPFSTSLIRTYCSRRFAYSSPHELEDIITYMHAVTTLPGSGEFGLSRILAPGAWAHRPMGERMTKLTMPTTFMFGEYDWMDPRVPMDKVQRQLMPTGSKVVIVPNAGHQLFIDNWSFFNKVLLEEMGWARSECDVARSE